MLQTYVTCQHCGGATPKTSQRCVSCGQDFSNLGGPVVITRRNATPSRFASWAWITLAVAACAVACVLFYVAKLPKHRFQKAMDVMSNVHTGMDTEQVMNAIGKPDSLEYREVQREIEATASYKASNGTVFIHFTMDRVDEIRVTIP